jgi:hypothetical protein
VPIPEGFTYYLRGDLGWAFVGSDPSFSESGAQYGAVPLAYGALSNRNSGIDDVFFGGFGAGAYITQHFRADITLEFRGTQDVEATATYIDAGPVTGSVRETVKLRSTVGLINAYWDRGSAVISRHMSARASARLQHIQRRHLTTEDDGTPPIATVPLGRVREVGLACCGVNGRRHAGTRS